MPERIMPGLGLRAFYDPGQRDWGTSVSEDLRRLSVLVQARALSRSTALPASGSAGDVFIVPAGAAAHANEIALWDGEPGAEAWVYITPAAGWQVWIEDEANGSAFMAPAGSPPPAPASSRSARSRHQPHAGAHRHRQHPRDHRGLQRHGHDPR